MPYRLDDIDCVSARGHSALGGTLAVQAVWRYDRPVDMGVLAEFHAALQRGTLGRVVAPAIIPAAGDRWSARGDFAPIEVAEAPVARAALDGWIDEQGRAELRTFGGPAWRLAVTGLDDGGSAVSLLASHTIADGRAFCAAIAAAVAHESTQMNYRTDEFGKLRLFGSDLRAAARRIGPTFGAVILAMRLAVTKRPPRHGKEDDQGFRMPTCTVTVPAPAWHAAAAARGGTGTTLAVAVLAAIATEIGRTDPQGKVQMMMPVSTRTEGDDRANALGSIEFEVDLRDGEPIDLAPLRTLMKDKLGAAADQGQQVPPLIPIAVALPRGLYGVVARLAATDATRTVCSNLGKLDPELRRIDGGPAAAMMLGLVNQSLSSRTVLTERGGNLYASLFESDDRINLRVSAFHPPKLVEQEQLTELLARVLAQYELTASAW